MYAGTCTGTLEHVYAGDVCICMCMHTPGTEPRAPYVAGRLSTAELAVPAAPVF